MKATLLVVLTVAAAVPVSAELILFWSTTGISDPNYVYYTGCTSFLPWFVPPTPVTELSPGAYDLFLWGRFVQNENQNDPNYLPAYSMIYGLDLKFFGDASVAQNVAYRHNGRWGCGPWIPLDGVMAAATSRGIEFVLPPDTSDELYIPETHEFLLGAARTSGLAGQTKGMSLDTAADGLGIAMRMIGGPDIPDPVVVPALVTFTPEPAGVGLLVLVGCLVRRR